MWGFSCEVSMIQKALDKTRGNQSKAARLLGLTRGTLIYSMKKYALVD
jgi:DNA-binding protein Fis